ncbi:ATP synthase subunit e, mitochondrial [Trichonephila clavata]|uniref:ATP synthase F(0) complex subunit e, mitochondrial n=1 Tax=Trichonephila clavata TaxID=2740835 RepID=A0A8X6HQP5_TRICU|nr:ATP synthase subunit e, mitochondrial [Trichonephila clavata]
MSTTAQLPPPLRVSPFIRACRYGALATGVVYGALRYKYLKRKETKRREFESKQKAILEVKRAEELKISQRTEMLNLAKECGIKPPAGF